jgi:hypothetical protein
MKDVSGTEPFGEKASVKLDRFKPHNPPMRCHNYY